MISPVIVRAAALAAALAWLPSIGGPGEFAGAVIRVGAGGDLQAALDAARPGDTILLASGAEFVGNFVLPAKRADAWITIRSDARGDDVPPPGVRVRPEHAPRLAAIRSPNSKASIRTASGAHHWRLELLEFPAAASNAATLVELGDGGDAQRTLDDVPHDLVVDRCYVHGDPAKGQKRGIGLNSAATTVSASYVADIKLIGQDSQAIAGWNGPGPFHIVNNYLEAAAEDFLLGGADPSIPGLVPADLVFRGNHVARPPEWRRQRWGVKNLVELKSARRALVERNLIEYNWLEAQPGYAIVFSPRSQAGRSPWAVVEDVTFRLNVVRHTAAAVNILGYDDTGPSGQARRIRIDSNLFYDVDRKTWGGNGFFLLLGDEPRDIVIERNTIVQSGNAISVYGGSAQNPRPVRGLVFKDNIAMHNSYGIHGAGRAVGLDTIEAFFPDALITHNVLAGGRASRYPPANLFPSEAELREAFVAPDAGDYRLKADSPFASAASDGGTLGAPVATLLKMTASVLAGRMEEFAVPRR